MKKISKILSVILAILMVMSIIPITASAEKLTSGHCGNNLTWTVDESTGTLTISGTGDMYDGEFSYPSWDAQIIESVIISEGVTSIGEYAFVSNTNIKNVSIADSVTDIGDGAFYNCTGLTDVIIGNGVTNIGDEAFYNCTGLTEVVIGKGVTTIGIRAFEYCSNLESVTIYNAVEEIVRDSFTGCSKLTDVYYFGTEAEWNAISKGFTLGGSIVYGTGLENATIHFLGEETHECSYNAVVTAPTCTEQGYTTYTCTVCGRKYKDNYTPKNGHKYKMAESKLKEATCTEGGYRYVQCLNCDHIWYFNFVDAKGHWYEETITMPTCTEPGYIYFVCKCGDAFGEPIDAFGHTEETIPAVSSTCTETGLTAGTKCSECGEIVKEQETVPANGHTPANAIEENYVAPTCTENGSKDVVVYCSVCDEEISRETVVIDATGHADNDGDGYCDNCDEQLCNHRCHKSGFAGFIWKVINFFNKLFGLNKVCECGIAHY